MPFFLPRRLIELEYLKTKNPSSEEEIKESKPYRNDMDFAFFAVNFGYTRAQFNALTPREIAFLYKAYEDSFVSRSYQLYNACFTAFYNANRGKKRRALKLFRRAHSEAADKEKIKENLAAVEESNRNDGDWLGRLYRENGYLISKGGA